MSSSNSSSDVPKEGVSLESNQILYLISKFLKSQELFQGSSEAFSNELLKSEALGTVVCWDGTEKVATIDDWDAKFESLPADALSNHLKNSIVFLNNIDSIRTDSLLETEIVKEDLASLKSKCLSFVDSLIKLKRINNNISRLSNSINRHQSDIDLLPRSMDTEVEESDEINDDDVVEVDQAGNTLAVTLVGLGKAKELAHQKKQLADTISERNYTDNLLRTMRKELARSKLLSERCCLARIGSGAQFASRLYLGSQNRINYTDSSYLRATERSIRCNYRILWSCLGHYPYPVYCVAIDRSGRFAITGADDYLVKLWNLDTGDLVYTCRGHLGEISILAVSPDNSLFASACTNGEVRVWRLRDGVCLRVMKHRDSVNWMQFDDDRGALVSAGDDGQCIVWDLAQLIPLQGGSLPLIDSLVSEWDQMNRPTQISRDLDNVPLTTATSLISTNTNEVNLSNNFNNNSNEAEVASSEALPYESDPYAATTSSSAEISVQFSSESSSSSSHQYSYSATLSDAFTWTSYIRDGLSSPRGSLFEWSSSSLSTSSIPLPSLPPQPGAIHFAPAVYDPRVAGSTLNLPENSFLVLPHMNDNTHAVTDGADIKVNCFDICPLGCVLVTGCEDGVARLWRFADEKDIFLRTGSVRKSTRAKELPQMNGLLSPTEIQRLQQVAKYLILRLEGHIRGVTDIHFSNVGDRILTSSTLDGTVRVWAFNREFTKSEHVLLNPMDQDERSQSLSGIPQGRRLKKPFSTPQVFNACWSADDLRILTLQAVKRSNNMGSLGAIGSNHMSETPTSLKVWDSMTGDLLKIISPISQFETKTLVPHPIEPDILLIGGKGGHLCVWDWVFERELTRVVIPNRTTPDPSLVAVHDAVFSPDGSRIVYTDALGRVNVLGLDRPDRFTSVKSEQYYSTEMAPTTHDTYGFAIDVATRLPVHLAPRGLICMYNGTPYDETVVVSQLGPMPESLDETRGERTGNKSRVADLGRVLERSYATFVRNKLRGRQPRTLRTVATTQAQRPSSSKAQPSATLSSSTSNAMGASRRYTTVPFDFAQYEPSSDEYDGDSDWEHPGHEDPEVAWAGRGGVPRRERVYRNAIDVDGNDDDNDSDDSDDEDDEDDEDGSDAMFGGRRSQRRLRSSRSIGLGRTIGSRRPQRNTRRARVITSDDEEDEDANDDDDDENIYNNKDDEVSRSRRIKPKVTKKLTSIAVKDSKPRPATSATRRQSSFMGRFEGTPGNRIVPVGTFVERQWLQETKQLDYMYVPQIGDRVYYYPQGHQETLQFYPESTSPPWNSFPAKWCTVDCEVRDISYDFPTEGEYYKSPSVVVKIILALCQIPQPRRGSSSVPFNLELVAPRTTRHSQQQEHLFTVSIRRSALPEFLILKSVVDRSMLEQWYPGKAIQAKFIEESIDLQGSPELICKLYHGIVLRLSCVSVEYPGSPWDAVEIRWTDDTAEESSSSADRISPWDVVETNPHGLDSLDVVEASRINNLISKTMEDEDFEAFRAAVDETIIPDYGAIIPMPIWVELIQERLRSGYYRQIPALEHDINLLAQNCVKFNIDGAEIVQKANTLVSRLLSIVRGNEQASSSSSSGLQSRTQQNLSSSSSSSSPAAVGQTKLRLTLRSPSKSFINTKAKAASSNDDDDDDDDDNEGNEDDDDDEDDDESPEQFGTRRYSSRTSSRNRFAVPSAHEDVQQKPATRMRLVMSRSTQSSQGGTDRKRRRGNDSDEQDEENDNDESESDDDEDERLNLRSKLGTSRRLATKKRVSYAEINDNEDDGAEDEDTSLKNRKASRSHSSSHSSSYHQVSSQSSTSDRSTRTREGAKYSSKVPEKASNTSSAHIEPTGRRPVRLDRDNLVRMNALVAKIEEGDVGGSFAEPVVEEDAPSYYEIIQQPMDLSTIKSNIANRRYSTFREVQEDILLMFSNCELYNDPNSDLARLARRLKKLVGPLEN